MRSTISGGGEAPTGSAGSRVSPRLRVAVSPAGSAAWRSGLTIALLGLLTTLPICIWIAYLQSHDQSAAAISMPSMEMNRMGIFWSFPILQAAGFAALLWAYFGLGLGLIQGSTMVSWFPFSPARSTRIHRQISLLVIGLIAVHVVATIFDAMGDNWKTALIPWQEGWSAAVLAYNLGIFAFYLALLLGPTYYLRGRLGDGTWRLAHRFVAVVYILALWHTLIIGADVEYYGWIRPFIWAMQIPLLLLLMRRLRQPSLRASRPVWLATLSHAGLVASAVAIAAIALLVATGDYASVVRSIQ